MPRYALLVEYDGTDLCGFQMQGDCPTVQGELERALGILLRESVSVHGAGRTDAGVHATGQVAVFESRSPLPPERRAVYALNSLLPRSIAVRFVEEVPAWFHARFSCLAREYEYLLWNAPHRPVHAASRMTWFRDPIPVEELNGELLALLGEHDFASFTRAEYREENTTRYLDRIELRRERDLVSNADAVVVFRIRGNAFLHNMIRILVGTILDRARGRLALSPGEILESRDRRLAGQTAPPGGLYFRHAYYPPMEGLHRLSTIENYPRFTKRAGPDSVDSLDSEP